MAAYGLLVLVSDLGGSATCPDARTGEPKWAERLPGKYTTSPLVCGDVVYAFADDGKSVLFRAAAGYEEVGRNELGGRAQATPAAAGGGRLVRTDAALCLLAGPK